MQESKGERGFSAVFLSYVVSATNFRPGAACVRGALVLPKLQKGGIFLKQTLATKTHAVYIYTGLVLRKEFYCLLKKQIIKLIH